MNTNTSSNFCRGLTSFALLAGLALAAPFGAEAHSDQKMTPEMRQKMATMHEEMAMCLKSNREMSECRNQMKTQMHQNCPKDGNCEMHGMMGEGMMGRGMMHKGRMSKGKMHQHGQDTERSQGTTSGKSSTTTE